MDSGTNSREKIALLTYLYIIIDPKQVFEELELIQTFEFRRNKPIFPFDKWNVLGTTFNHNNRTNNQCEGWNNRFTNLVGTKHSTI